MATITNYADDMSPFCTFKFKKGLPDWYSEDIVELSIARDRLHRIGKRTNNDEMIEFIPFLMSWLKEKIICAKTDYFSSLIDKNINNSKSFWNAVKQLTKGDGKCCGISRVINPATGDLCLPQDTPEIINVFFAGIGAKLADALPDSMNPGTLAEVNYHSEPYFAPSPDRIISYLRKVDPHKSSGCPTLTTRLYIDILPCLSEQLSFMYGLAIKTKCFPSDLKKGVVTPIP